MHAGISGIIIYSLVTGIVLKIIDSLTFKVIPLWLSLATISIPSLILITSADLPTTLLSHGLLPSIILLYLLRNNNILLRKIKLRK
jgi:hypothetical protein